MTATEQEAPPQHEEAPTPESKKGEPVTPKQDTTYLVFQQQGTSWLQIGAASASKPQLAVEEVLGENPKPGEYAAVAARYWTSVPVSVETKTVVSFGA
jgi:hypothetical protein